MCGKKKRRRNHVNAWLWNEEVKEAIRQKKVLHKKMFERK